MSRHFCFDVSTLSLMAMKSFASIFVDVATFIQCRDILTYLSNKATCSECCDITYSDVVTLDVMVSSVQALANVATLF